MEPVQTILLLVIVILTVVLTILGIQVFLILREIKKTVEKTNKVLDHAGIIAESISAPASTFSSVIMSIKTGAAVVNWIKKIFTLLLEHLPHKDNKEPQEEQLAEKEPQFHDSSNGSFTEEANSRTPSTPHESEDEKPMVRRFFKGIGRKIRI